MSPTNATIHDDMRPRHSHSRVLWILAVAVGLALAGNVYQWVRADHQSRDLALLQQSTEQQMAKLTDATSTEAQLNQQRFDAMQAAIKTDLQGATAATLRQARADMKRSSAQLAENLEQRRQELEQENQQVASQLSDLKQDTSSKFQEASGKLQDTNTKLDQVSTTVDQHGSDLKRMVGDMGVMSGDIATNGKELAALKELGSRNYFEFDLSKSKAPQKVGDIRVLLKKADPKHNRFTLAVYADDKIVEKQNKTINEPVQLYVAGNRQPYEIVVNQVKNNEVVGYLAIPKVKMQRGQTTASSSF
jgi:DNA repair exonuclease SbcCD ATPase subunit